MKGKYIYVLGGSCGAEEGANWLFIDSMTFTPFLIQKQHIRTTHSHNTMNNEQLTLIIILTSQLAKINIIEWL